MSSFRKRVERHPIPGTRTSPQNGQVITSSGNPSLDVLLGGGLPIGSICLLEEDKFGTYSRVLAKYFMAEGVLSNQSIFLGSLDDTPNELIKKLPQHCTEPAEKDSPETAKNGLRIAWRYTDLPIVNSEHTTLQIGHNFNLMEFMDPQLLIFAQTTTWSDDPSDNDKVDVEGGWYHQDSANKNDANNGGKELELENSTSNATPKPALCLDDTLIDDKICSSSTETAASTPMPSPPSFSKPSERRQLFHNKKYIGLLDKVHTLLRQEKFHSKGLLVNRSLCRVCLTSMGSPQWFDENFGEDLLKFLTLLRATVHSSVSVCFITMPMHLIAKYDDSLVAKIRNLFDYAVELESFAGSDKETNPAFKEYNGLFHLHKMAAVNALSAYIPETTDLAFKLKRKKFVIEKLHLPPELEDESTAKQDKKPTLSCSSVTNPNASISMDF